MSKFEKMNREEKRSARLLALQFLYANEITSTKKNIFFKELFDVSSSINGFSQKHEILSNFEIYSDMALSILPSSFDNKFKKIRDDFKHQSTEEIIQSIHDFQNALDSFKDQIQNYAIELVDFSINNTEDIDKEIISRSQNWDSSRITLMDKLILRLVIAEIVFIKHVPPKVSIAEGIEIAKTMSTDDSSAFVNGILDSFFNDWLNKKIIIGNSKI